MPGEGIDDLVDVLCPQPVLVAILDEALAGIDHEDAAVANSSPGSAFLVQHQNAGGNAGAVEQVGGQADDALDEAAPNEVLADHRLGTAPEQHAVRVNHRALAGALERGEDVQQEGVVAVLGRRDAEVETAIQVVGRVESAGP